MTSESNPTRASVTVSTSAKDVFLATFPVLPPGAGDSMAFNVYGKLSDPTVKPSTTSTAAGKKRRLLVAETEKSQFSGDSAATKGHARYLVGIYSPSKHSLVLKEALPMLMTSRLKALTDPDARVIDKVCAYHSFD